MHKAPIEDKAARNGTERAWDFHPADAPHRNGAAEAAVKLMKRALTSIGGTVDSLTSGELQTLFYQVANLTNEKCVPISGAGSEPFRLVWICSEGNGVNLLDPTYSSDQNGVKIGQKGM